MAKQKEEGTMAKEILVALKDQHRLGEIIPYVEEIPRPGMRVIFLVPYPTNSWVWLQDHWVTTESPREAMLAGRKIMERHSWRLQRELAEERIAPMRHLLQKRGVEVIMDVYTGSLASVVETYTRKGDVHLIMRTEHQPAIMRLVQRAITFLGLFKRAHFPPVLVLRPGQ
ncbi:MAG TPA: hypothetical protein VGR30_11345 [Candidatus Binatia bacterium]|nr:hypothetical protein [Candidatus Binatia bacterium]